MKLKSWHKEAIRAALIVGLTLLTMGACQSMPAEWRIGAGGAVRAALGCIDEDDSKLTRRQRVARCTGRILACSAPQAWSHLSGIRATCLGPPSRHNDGATHRADPA